VDLPRSALFGAVLLVALVAGPWLARVATRLAARDETARPSGARIAVMTALFAGLLAGGVMAFELRPATAAFAWAAGAAVVLCAVDLSSHRLPDRVTCPAYAVCAAALLVDAAVLGSWGALARAVLAAAVTFAVAAGAAALPAEGVGFGDVKLLGLLGLVLGWAGWGVLLAGVFFGLLTGALVSLGLLVTRRAGWRTRLPFGPPLLAGAVLALALAGSGSLV
jgi:leader peptidase (prepilin peptidase) / N-methyltransferase